jgi:phage terminase small subunit
VARMAKKAEKKTEKESKLTEKQMLFCIYYAKSFNATRSYEKAYGCKYETAVVNGSKLLTNTKVRKTIEELKASNIQASLLKMDDVVGSFMEIAFNEENYPKDRMRALEWLSDHIGLASDEQKARIKKLKAEATRIEKETAEGSNAKTVTVVLPEAVKRFAE